MKILLYNNYSFIQGTLLPELFEVCTLTQSYFFRDRSGKLQRKERRRCYLSKTEFKFPTGWLYSKIIPTISPLSIEYEIIDNRESIKQLSLSAVYPFTPRGYQNEVVDLVTLRHKERGIIEIGTGGGKSFIGGRILQYFGAPSLYIVPSLLLLNQTSNEFIKWFGKDRVGVVGGGVFEPSLITVATAQTLWSKIDTIEVANLLKDVQVLILDEAHRITKPKAGSYSYGNTWYKIAMKAFNARVRIGLTATPGSEDSYSRELLGAVTGKILYTKSLSWLIANGYLSPLKVIIYNINIPNQINNWAKAYSQNILNNNERNSLIVKQAKKLAKEGKRVLIIVSRIDTHGRILTNKFKGLAESLYGEDKTTIREEVLTRFINKETLILVSSIICEGVDLPEMDVVIMALAGKGGEEGTNLRQKLGRVVRKCVGKSSAMVIDFWDNDGYVEYIDSKNKVRSKPSILLKHSMQRLKIYKSEPMLEIIKE